MLHCPFGKETVDIHGLLFLEQKLCCADMRCLSLTLYKDSVLSPLTSTLDSCFWTAGHRTVPASAAAVTARYTGVDSERGRQITVNALIVCYV